MIALLKYGTGVPFKRLERLQEQLGMPLAATTQWDLVAAAAQLMRPVLEALIRLAAQGSVMHNDDRKHAGENIADVLKHRAHEQPAPIQMCDALSRNTPKGVETLIANCLAHGRRQVVEVVENF